MYFLQMPWKDEHFLPPEVKISLKGQMIQFEIQFKYNQSITGSSYIQYIYKNFNILYNMASCALFTQNKYVSCKPGLGMRQIQYSTTITQARLRLFYSSDLSLFSQEGG